VSAVGPWDTPLEEASGAASHRWLAALGAWGMAGASVGSAVGGVLQITQAAAGASSTGGTIGMLAGGVLGGVALVVERRAAEERPVLVDASGRGSRPLHGLLFAGPVVAAIPALLVLGVVATVGIGHIAPAVAFSITALAVAWAGLRVWSTHRFTTALEAVERGDLGVARERLASLARAWVATRSARTAARLNLGMMALQQGDATEALRWYDQVAGRSASAWVDTGRALALLLAGELDAAAEALGRASASAGARQVQEQLDAVRVLLVWRSEGSEAARQLGQRLMSPVATPLHRGLMLALDPRDRRSDSVDDELAALLHSGLGQALPELEAVRVRVPAHRAR